MNRLYLICVSVACLSFFSSCTKSDIDKHCLDVVYPSPYKLLYADQLTDSLIFATFDSYEAISNQPDWITIMAGASHSINYDSNNLYYLKVLLAFAPNLTGETRVGTVQINSYEYSTAGVYYQTGYLNINNPAPKLKYANPKDVIPVSATFELQVAGESETDSICFTVSQSWTLNFEENADRSWATISNVSGQEGHNNVTLTFTPNTDTVNSRTTTLVLKSSGVSNLITIKQLAAKNQEE